MAISPIVGVMATRLPDALRPVQTGEVAVNRDRLIGVERRAGLIRRVGIPQSRRTPMSLPDLSGRSICILATHGFEQSELIEPRDTLREAGATVHVVSPESGEIRGWKGDDWGDSVSVDAPLQGAERRGLSTRWCCPGGQINPDLLRVDETAMALDQGLCRCAASPSPLSAMRRGC